MAGFTGISNCFGEKEVISLKKDNKEAIVRSSAEKNGRSHSNCRAYEKWRILGEELYGLGSSTMGSITHRRGFLAFFFFDEEVMGRAGLEKLDSETS
jgi:hypothetical protein